MTTAEDALVLPDDDERPLRHAGATVALLFVGAVALLPSLLGLPWFVGTDADLHVRTKFTVLDELRDGTQAWPSVIEPVVWTCAAGVLVATVVRLVLFRRHRGLSVVGVLTASVGLGAVAVELVPAFGLDAGTWFGFVSYGFWAAALGFVALGVAAAV